MVASPRSSCGGRGCCCSTAHNNSTSTPGTGSTTRSRRGAASWSGEPRPRCSTASTRSPTCPGPIRMFGGNLSPTRRRSPPSGAAERELRNAGARRRQRRRLIEAETRIARRSRYGAKMYANKREPKIVMNARKRRPRSRRAGCARCTGTGSRARRLAEAEAAAGSGDPHELPHRGPGRPPSRCWRR